MTEILVRNLTTGEGKVFNPIGQEFEYKNFCRKAVLDYMFNEECDCTVAMGTDKYLGINPETPEPLRWFAACVLYMNCEKSGEWGDILDIYEIGVEENGDDEEED